LANETCGSVSSVYKAFSGEINVESVNAHSNQIPYIVTSLTFLTLGPYSLT